MQFSRTRSFGENEIIKGFDGRGNVKSLVFRAAGIKGANEVQRVTLLNNPTGGTFTLTFSGQTTAAIAYNAATSAVVSALEALSNIGVGDVGVTGNAGGPYTITFQAALANAEQPQLTGSGANLTGGGAGDAHDVLVETLIQGHAAAAADADGRYLVYEGTILTVDPANTDKVIEYTAQGGEAILGILAHRVELWGKTSPDHDRHCAAFWHNCVFDKNLVRNYTTYAAALATALPTCRFE